MGGTWAPLGGWLVLVWGVGWGALVAPPPPPVCLRARFSPLVLVTIPTQSVVGSALFHGLEIIECKLVSTGREMHTRGGRRLQGRALNIETVALPTGTSCVPLSHSSHIF